MYAAQFPECCGIGIVALFTGGAIPSTERELRDNLRQLINQNKGRVLATLNNEQREVYQPLLKHYRFKMVDEFNNPNSGNRVYVYSARVSSRYKFPAPKYATTSGIEGE